MQEWKKIVVSEIESIQSKISENPFIKDAIDEIFVEQSSYISLSKLINKLNNCSLNGLTFLRVLTVIPNDIYFLKSLINEESEQDIIYWILKLSLKYSDDIEQLFDQEDRPYDWIHINSKLALDYENKTISQLKIKRVDGKEFLLECGHQSILKLAERLILEYNSIKPQQSEPSEEEITLISTIRKQLAD